MPLSMARNDRVVTSWSQPQRTTLSKGHSGCLGTPGTGDLDDLDDIMSLLSSCNSSKVRKEPWPLHSSNTRGRSFTSRDCCLKNGRIHCSCLWSKNEFTMDGRSSCKRNIRKTTIPKEPVLLHERKIPFWHESSNSAHTTENKMAEEYVLDDSELRFDSYDMPFDIPKRHQLRKIGKVKTVSIIDTLSELASGATDREDEGGFSSAVSESAVLGCDLYRPRMRHGRPTGSRRGHASVKGNYLTSTPVADDFASKILHHAEVNDNLVSCHESLCGSKIKNFHGDDGNFTCSSLKRTLKYLRKAVSSNVVEEEMRTRRHFRRNEERDAFRHCFSDSEIPENSKPWNPVRRERQESNSHSKCRTSITTMDHGTPESIKYQHGKPVIRGQLRSKAETPEWIKKVFSAAKKGEVEKLKAGLKGIDSSLVRNLSDDHGNNLWHICAAQNHIQCLDWLCSRNQQQTDALNDENKHGFTPVALAVKHGSLLAVQWLIHNTISKSQLLPSDDNRTLLHIAAKYGQEASVQWLLSYMNSQDMNVNCRDSEGNNALHLAAKHGHINCAKALIFQNVNLKARNEQGLQPLNLAVKYSQVNCADYLLAMESCYNLAANNLKQQLDLQEIQKENAEMKSYFKELLTLTKRLQHRQRELVHSFTQADHSTTCDSVVTNRAAEKHAKYVDDYPQILASVIADEENRLRLVEERWKKSRKLPKSTESKKMPLDLIRSQFSHILDKVSYQSPAVPSTPETSDDCWQSGEDVSSTPLCVPAANVFGSTPDVIHALPNQNVPFMNSRPSHLISEKSTSFSNKLKHAVENVQCDIPIPKTKYPSDLRTNTVRPSYGGARDVNLQVFFKQNPNLRQTSETCSVLEVLEPSSSDSDECMGSKRHLVKPLSAEEVGQSSSSSAAETLSPSSCGPSSTGSKKSGSRSSSNGSRHDVTNTRGNSMSHGCNSGVISNTMSGEMGNKGTDSANSSGNADTLNTDSSHISSFDNCLAEPDLIRGTQKKKRPPNSHLDRDERQEMESKVPDVNLTDNPSVSTEDSESLEADHSFCSAIDIPESLVPGQVVPNPSMIGTGVKKKNFLLKFALKGRWPSKPRARSSKNEISAEEFRETYSRSSEIAIHPSQCTSNGNLIAKKPPLPGKDLGKPHEERGSSAITTNGLESGTCQTSCGDLSQSLQRLPMALLPPRRDPPPVPPRPPRDKDSSQLHTADGLHIDITNSASCVANCVTGSAVSLHDPYMATNSSNLWQSPDSKSLFRPASSASCVESLSRVEDGFPLLNKSSSASTEMLSALDSSTAGRQSPAPSEVSKTESALSPPSDVSKTESARYLGQLGRIEESGHLALIKATVLQKNEDKVMDALASQEERCEVKPKKSGGSKRHGADKPWYEFSDEEDVITPQRYEVMSGKMRSSSEDEEIVGS